MLREGREYFVQGCKVRRAEMAEALTERPILLPRDRQNSRCDAACLFDGRRGATKSRHSQRFVRTSARLRGARVVEIILALSWAHIVVAHKEARACI